MKRDSSVSVHDTMTFENFLQICADRHGDLTALSIFKDNKWKTISFKQLRECAYVVAGQLQVAGLKPGDRAALLGDSSIDWVIHFFAIQLCGATAIPLDAKLTAAELTHILNHCESKMLLVSENQVAMASTLRGTLAKVPKVLSLEDWEQMAPLVPMPFTKHDAHGSHLAVICYTSGTSGAPKGVEVPLRSLIFEAHALVGIGGTLEKNEVMLSILPLNHLFGLTAGIMYCLYGGFEHCFLHSLEPEAIQKCLKERSVTTVLAVPLYARMLMRGIRRKILDEHGVSADRMFRAMLKTARALPTASRNYLFKDIQAGMGGSLKKFVCGGASIEPTVYDFFRAINIPIFIGYGLTETGPVIAVNSMKEFRKDSVGKLLPGVEVKIVRSRAEDSTGEIFTRGPHLMKGYFKAPELTSEVMDSEGWFRTGDLGFIDKDGFLFVRGRLKALIVLSSGKKVYPEEVESVISKHEIVRAVCVLGISDPAQMMSETVTAVVLPTDEAIAAAKGDNEKLRLRVVAAVEQLCLDLASFKRPAKIIVRTQPFVMTTSMKIKRDALLAEITSGATGAGADRK